MKHILNIALLLISSSLFSMSSRPLALMGRCIFTLEERAQRIVEAYKIHLPVLQELDKQLAEEALIKREFTEEAQDASVDLRED